MVAGALGRTLDPRSDRDLHRLLQLCVPGRSGRLLALLASLTERYPYHPAEKVVVMGSAGPREVLKLRTSAYGLRRREKEIVDLAVRGYSNKQILEAFSTSGYTVEEHLSNIFEKVGVRGARSPQAAVP